MKQTNYNIIRFLSAQTISLLGSSLVQYGLIWYITLTSQSGLMLTVATICGFLPQILAALFAGSYIDRYDAKKVVVISDSLIAFATLLLAIIFITGSRNIWFIFIVLAVRSAGTGVQTPCVNTIIPLLVEKEKLMRFNGINSTLSSIILFLSPAISGMIMTFISLEALLFVDVITAMIGVTITLGIPIHKKIQTQAISPIEESRFGFQFVKSNKKIMHLFMYQFIVLFLITPAAILTPLFISRVFGNEIWRLTLGEMTYSLGMIAGGFLISLWGGFSNRLKTIGIAGLLYGILMIGLGSSLSFVFYLCINTMIGLTSPSYSTAFSVYLQENVPAEMHGRIFSLMQIGNSCALPIGMCLFGPLADVVSIASILIICGSIVICASLYFYKKMV